jgi:hypothetical protein
MRDIELRYALRWSTFGKQIAKLYLNDEMGTAIIHSNQGLNKDSINMSHIALTAKHFIATGEPSNGNDDTLATHHPSSFEVFIDAGSVVMSVNSGRLEQPAHPCQETHAD